MKTTIVLVDGGFLRSMSKAAKKTYNPAFIDQFAKSCVAADEECLRILYYDCAPFQGNVILPVSGNQRQFTGSDQWLHDVAALDLFAVRRGVLKFRGFERKKDILPHPVSDEDFKPQFEHTNDTDCVPAMKFARKSGLQVILIQVPNCKPARELKEHSDFLRVIPWPA